jgi:hypothetical protein
MPAVEVGRLVIDRMSDDATSAEPNPRPWNAASTASRPINSSGTASGMARRSRAPGRAIRCAVAVATA